VFAPGKRLKPHSFATGTKAQVIRTQSTGNGAWIMQQCAEALSGRCSIRFEPNATVFTFSCPLKRPPTEPSFPLRHPIGTSGKCHASAEEEFCLPHGTWGIALDDSRIQRKLLDRFLNLAGIESSRRVILGANSEEVFGFVETVKRLMSEYPEDRFIVIADENLDIVDGGACGQTVSGSLCVQNLRSELGDAERRLLALIRSANDSALDIQMYKARAHGVLLKEPIKKDGVVDLIKPFWLTRFPSDRRNERSSQMIHADMDAYGPSSEDILEALRVIGALSAVNGKAKLQRRWHAIRERLHALKGDLMTMMAKEKIKTVLCQIDDMLSCSRLPNDFATRWADVQSLVESVL